LYILPFDHRGSFQSGLFGWKGTLTSEQTDRVAASKAIIYEGLLAAVADGVPKARAGILVDEQFGAAILRDARARGFLTAAPAEKSGQHEFDFEYGDDYARHIEAFSPTFCKVLVRHNPEGDAEMNRRQAARLRHLSEYLHRTRRKFMFELLVPAERAELEELHGDQRAYDRSRRPRHMVDAIHELQDAGVEPDIWKIEGLDRTEDCAAVVAAARRAGRARRGRAPHPRRRHGRALRRQPEHGSARGRGAPAPRRARGRRARGSPHDRRARPVYRRLLARRGDGNDGARRGLPSASPHGRRDPPPRRAARSCAQPRHADRRSRGDLA